MNPLPKPLFGSPCNHCGICCEAEVCHVGKALGLDTAPCPALVTQKTGERHCLFVIMEKAAQREGMTDIPLVQTRLGVGVGCTMHDASTTDADCEKLHERWREKWPEIDAPNA